ncbi:CNP1-like family protein [Propionivibrio limicola]|uniref:CNP1-like family protein n=1 Tax=Propionivibrio limicola TaxID=167645 RepID=UPI001292642B|nr:CNP1-like family protein [Propionivibrio limicola]
MIRTGFFRRAVLSIVALVWFSAQVGAVGFDSDFDEEEKPWREIEVQLPTFPESANLIPFKVGSVSDKKFMVDGNSISVGADGVIRYTLVIVSDSGAQNISYEGMRCLTGERRVYAFGRSDKTWSRARSNAWTKIRGGTNDYRIDLFANFFCIIDAPTLRDAEDVRRVLRSGGATSEMRP